MEVELLIALAIGWGLDFLFGDPLKLPHPVVGMGRWIAFWEKRLNRDNHRKAKGAMLVVASRLLLFGLTAFLFPPPIFKLSSSSSSFHLPAFLLRLAFSVLLIFFCLAGHTLRCEVRMVFEALDHSLEDGRRQVARIVGRDTQSLSAQEVRTAALETLAENLSDGVVAPLFWLFLLGIPGMLTYKLINTFDSMIIHIFYHLVCGVLSEKLPTPVRRVGVMDTFGESGPAADLLKLYGLSAENLVKVCKEMVK